MNTKGTRILAVLAVLAMAFAVVSVIPSESSDAAEEQEIAYISGVIVNDEGTTQTVYSKLNKVVLNGNCQMGSDTNGAIFIIEGALEVPSEFTLTVLGNSKLVIRGEAVVDGKLIVDEQYVDESTGLPKEGNGVVIIEGGSLTVNGKVMVDGVMNIPTADDGGNVYVKADGEFTIGTTGTLDIDEGGVLYVDKDALATVKGKISADSIKNSGTIVLNTTQGITEAVNIDQAADGAVVDIQKVAIISGTITVSDDGMTLYSYKDSDNREKKTVAVGDETYTDGDVTYTANLPANDLTIGSNGPMPANTQGVVTKLKITEKVTNKSSGSTGDIGYVELAGKTYDYNMVLEGDVAVKSEAVIEEGEEGYEEPGTAKAAIDLTAKRGAIVAADTELHINSNVTFTNNTDSKLTVAGYFNANHGSTKGLIKNDGVVYMSGNGIMEADKVISKENIVGARVDYSDYVQYMKLDKAIDTGNNDEKIDTITATANMLDEDNPEFDDVSKTATIRKDLTLVSGPGFTIGANNNDVVLTLAKGATLKSNNEINVGGTLFAEDKTDVTKRDKVKSDVYSEEVDESGKAVRDGWAKWTNLATALNEATPGTKITVTTNEYIVLKNNTEIKEGVTLYVPTDGCPGIVLKDGVTLSVNGTYDNESDIYAQTIFSDVAKNVTGDKSSAIVVNGKMIDDNLSDSYGKSKSEDGYDINKDGVKKAYAKLASEGAPIAGAYYVSGDRNMVTKLETAIDGIADIEDSIYINGAVTVGTIKFEGTDDCNKIIVNNGIEGIDTILTVATMTLKESSVEVSAETVIEAEEEGEEDTVLVGIISGKFTDGTNSIVLKSVSSGSSKATITESDGLSFGGAFVVDSKNDQITVTEGTVLADGANVTDTIDDEEYVSTVTVATGATIQAGKESSFETIVVNGTLDVPNGKTITADRADVFGTVMVAEPTSSKGAGNLTVDYMNVGIASFDEVEIDISASATIQGPVNPMVRAIVLNGSTLDESALDKTETNLPHITEFYVKNTLWITVYAKGENEAISDDTTYFYVPTDLKDCIFVSWQDENGKDIGADQNVGDFEKLYANINYEIYTVKIVTDSGIKAVSIDNIQMLRSPAEVSGTNTFTTLHNIEAGTHKVTYTLQDGYEGTAKLYTEYGTILQDLGFTVSGTDPDDRELTLQLYGTEKEVPAPTPEPEKESEWTITTILLLVLVILIAIMAVIVAMKLMRS